MIVGKNEAQEGEYEEYIMCGLLANLSLAHWESSGNIINQQGNKATIQFLKQGEQFIQTSSIDCDGNEQVTMFNVIVNSNTSDTSPTNSRNQKINLFNIYPNPSRNGNLTIQFSEISDFAILQIINSQGLTIYERKIIKENNLTIDTKNIPSGIYFIRYTNLTDQEIEKVGVNME